MRALALVCAIAMIAGAEEAPFPKPTSHHLALKRAEGTWDAVVKVYMGHGKPPLVSKAEEINKMVPGGLWLESTFRSEYMGTPFEGRGLLGYDPATGKHIGTWIDSTVPTQSISSGTCSNDCREVTMFFDGPGMDGKPTTYKKVSVDKDPDHRAMTMFTKGKNGDYVLTMEIEYTRRK